MAQVEASVVTNRTFGGPSPHQYKPKPKVEYKPKPKPKPKLVIS